MSKDYTKYKEGEVELNNVSPSSTHNINPNSLKNLKPKWDTEHMRKMAYKSADKRRANKEAKEKMKETVAILKGLSDGVVEDMPSGLTVMQLMMLRAIQDGDPVEAAKLASTIAEYQQPKLQRTENLNANIDFGDLSDEELERQLAILNGKPEKEINQTE